MVRTSTKTCYPDLVDAHIANDINSVKKFTNYLNSIGSINYDPKLDSAATSSSIVTKSTTSPLYVNNKPTSTINSDGSYEVEARITFYSPDEPTSDYNTRQGLASKTDVYGKLQQGKSVAIDPAIIPYGTNISIPSLGDNFIAMDTGGAVIRRTASRNTGGQPVIDVFVSSYAEQLKLERNYPSVIKVKVNQSAPFTASPVAFTSPVTTSEITSVSLNELSIAGGKRDLNGDLTPQAATCIDYHNQVKSGNPITNISDFFSKLDKDVLSNYDNDFIFFWYKKYKNAIEVIKEQTELQDKSFFDEPSDSIGLLANSRVKFDDAVSPLFDLNCSFGAPNTIPTQLANKLSNSARDVNEELSIKTSTLMKTNLINLQRVNDTYNIASDSTQSHGLNLITDLNYYLDAYNSLPSLVSSITTELGRTYEYVCYFSNINDKTGYNPRDYLSCNIQNMPNIQYSANVENTLQNFDAAHNPVKESRSSRTIAKALGNVVQTSEQPKFTTKEINNRFKYTARTFNLPKPASLTQSAQAKLNAALSNIKIPNANLSLLNNEINRLGISNLPGGQALTAPVTYLTKSVNNINSLVQSPTLNMPNILPSLDPGSFPEIAALITDTNFSDLKITNPIALLQSAEQIKNVACNFRLPVIGDVDFGDFLTGDLDFDIESLEAKFRSITSKFPKEDDFVKFFTKLVPDFKGVWKDFYSRFFECSNKSDS